MNFDHIHMGDLLREVAEHPNAEIAGVCDRDVARMSGAIATFQIPPERVFTDVDACLAACRPDLVVLCPATADHAAAVEQVAPHRVDMLVEKPFNQNGRRTPHLSWMRAPVGAGLIGEPTGVHVAIDGDHSFIAGTP